MWEKCGREATATVSMVGISIEWRVRGGHFTWETRRAYIAMLCEALCASYGDIAVVVPATLLRLLSPLLERHGDGAAGLREGGVDEGARGDMLATMLV